MTLFLLLEHVTDARSYDERRFFYGNNNIKMAEKTEIHVNFDAVKEKNERESEKSLFCT